MIALLPSRSPQYHERRFILARCSLYLLGPTVASMTRLSQTKIITGKTGAADQALLSHPGNRTIAQICRRECRNNTDHRVPQIATGRPSVAQRTERIQSTRNSEQVVLVVILPLLRAVLVPVAAPVLRLLGLVRVLVLILLLLPLLVRLLLPLLLQLLLLLTRCC